MPTTPDAREGFTPRLRMFAGPNGSGKSRLIQNLSREHSPTGRFSLHHYVNADDLHAALLRGGIDLGHYGLAVTWPRLHDWLGEAKRIPTDHDFLGSASMEGMRLTAPAAACDTYVAALIADFLREQLLASRESFSFETVMSHESKVEFLSCARDAGYRTYLYFICTDSPSLNLRRIQGRVALGGHDVPEDKAVARYHRCLQLLPRSLADTRLFRGFLFDNSGLAPRWVAEVLPDGSRELRVPADQLPGWYRHALRA